MSILNKSLTNTLFSKSQQQVLGLLYGQYDRDFYTNEIIRLTNAGTGAIQRELTKLEAAGILTVKQLGNQKRYQANQELPYFSELRGIVLKSFGLADVLKSALRPIMKKINFAFIYGSIARQTDTANSDIDLLIISDQLTYGEVFRRLSHAEETLCRKINPTFYTPDDWKEKLKKKNHFIEQVLSQPKIFLLGESDELVEFGQSGENGSIES